MNRPSRDFSRQEHHVETNSSVDSCFGLCGKPNGGQTLTGFLPGDILWVRGLPSHKDRLLTDGNIVKQGEGVSVPSCSYERFNGRVIGPDRQRGEAQANEVGSEGVTDQIWVGLQLAHNRAVEPEESPQLQPVPQLETSGTTVAEDSCISGRAVADGASLTEPSAAASRSDSETMRTPMFGSHTICDWM